MIDREVRARTQHLVDLENLLGDPWARQPVVGRVLEQFLLQADWRRGDLVTIAANPYLVREFCWDMPVECSIHAARGPDGADHALLEQASPVFVASRVGRLVIGSGDGIFVDEAIAVRERGIEVVVIARAGAVNSRFRAEGFRIVTFDPEFTPAARAGRELAAHAA